MTAPFALPLRVQYIDGWAFREDGGECHTIGTGFSREQACHIALAVNHHAVLVALLERASKRLVNAAHSEDRAFAREIEARLTKIAEEQKL